MDDKLEIKNRFRAIRKRFGLSQDEMAEKLGKTQTSISQIEGGKYGIALDTLVALEMKLNVNREWLLHGMGEMLLSDSRGDKAQQADYIEELKAAYEKMIQAKDSVIQAKDWVIAELRADKVFLQEIIKPKVA